MALRTCMVVVMVLVVGGDSRAAEPTFERDVVPILAARCLGCHGGVTRKAGLDLRQRASLLKAGRNGPVLVPGKPEDSRFWHVLAEDTMPREDPKLTQREKDLIRRWIANGAPDESQRRGDKKPERRAAPRASADVAAQVDALVDAHLRQCRLPSSPTASDTDLLRRMHLDLTGRIPSADRALAFLQRTDAGKVDRELDALLRDATHARHLAELWHNAIVPLDLNRRLYDTRFLGWLAARLENNEPWNRTVVQILSATGDTRDNAALGFYQAHRRPNLMAREATRIFLGVRMECVQCHDHPFARWTQADYWGLAAFFNRTQVKRVTAPAAGYLVSDVPEALFGGSGRAGTLAIPGNAIRNVGRVVPARLLDGSIPELDEPSSYRRAYANWVAARDNPYFARATVNRLWAHLFGRGLIHPVDDLTGLVPAEVPEVLDLLAEEFVASDFDLRHLIRCICATRAYRRSARPQPGNEQDPTGLSHRRVRPLTAATLHDSLCVALGVPEIDLAPGQLSLGPDARTRFVNHFNTQDAEETTDTYSHAVPQALRLMNGKPFASDKPQLGKLLPKAAAPRAAIEHLFLRALTRPPSEPELERMLNHVREQGTVEAGYADVLWALVNSTEFLMNR